MKSVDCKNCYTCETDVDKSITRERLIQIKAERCKKCYTCETDVDKSITADGTLPTPEGKSRAELCQKCYACETGIDKSVNVDNRGGQQSEQSRQGGQHFCWYFFPTNACNLTCKYCYANNQPGYIDRDTMHQILEFVFVKHKYPNVTCHFFGGEPLVMWETVVDMVQLGNELAKQNEVNVVWSMTTNGVLLDDLKLDFMEQNFRKGNPFLLSIDGRPETHDKYRVFADGKPSHHMIPVDEILKRFPGIECRPTINPDTAKDWFEDFRYLRNRGFRSIAIEPNFEVDWTVEQLRDYEETLRKLGKYWIYAYRTGRRIPMKFLEAVQSRLNAQAPDNNRMCGVAYNCAGIDHRGKLYACQRYASYNDPERYAIGDVVRGFDEYLWLETQNLFRGQVHGDVSEGYNCATCPIRLYCMKGCNAANKKFMGSRERSLPQYCELSMIEVRVALEILSEAGLLAAKQNQAMGCSCK